MIGSNKLFSFAAYRMEEKDKYVAMEVAANLVYYLVREAIHSPNMNELAAVLYVIPSYIVQCL